MSIFIIGIINMYNIHIYGIEGIYPIIEYIRNEEKWWNCGGIINIKESNIIIILLLNILFYIIFNSGYNFINKYYNLNYKGVNSMEYIFLISLGLLGLNIIILSKDLILIFISLELYSLSVYLLILLKITKNSTRMSIVYLIVNSLSSYMFLLGVSIIYKYTGSLILDEINNILISKEINNNINIGVLLLLLSILIKLGTVPFNYWVLRLYTTLESRILLYQIIIPKIVYIFLLNNIYKYIILELNIEILKKYIIIIYLISILSVIIGSIGGLFNNYFKSIITYSSILNMGFILLGIISNNNINIWWEYIIIYVINTLSIYLGFLLINPKLLFYKPEYFKIKKEDKKEINYNKIYPYFTICILLSIFSFIGIPPLAGFYAKLNIFMNIINTFKEWGIISIIILLIGTFISACFYLKFILFFFIKKNKEQIINFNEVLITNSPISISYYLSFFSLFLITYPFIYNYIYPIYLLIL